MSLVTVLTPRSTGGGGEPTTIFLDEFNDVDGTALASHTPDVGGPWGAFGAFNTLNTTGNRARSASGIRGNALALGVTDFVATGQCNVVASRARLYFRYVDAANYWYADFAQAAASAINIVEVVGGSPTTRATVTDEGGDVIFTLTVAGASVSLSGTSDTVPFGPLAYTMASSLSGTSMAIYVANASSYFERLEVSTP